MNEVVTAANAAGYETVIIADHLTWRKMVEVQRGRELNRILAFTSRNMLTFAVLVVLALWVAA